MKGWDKYLTPQEHAIFHASGWGARQGLGSRPVVLVVDVSYGFCGERPEAALESIRSWHNSCGARAWDGIAAIKQLLDLARERRIPIIYSTAPVPRPDHFDRGRWTDKNPKRDTDYRRANQIVQDIAPTDGDLVIEKGKPSVFFGTLLASYLADLRADTLVVCGTTTSGCVRATVVDAFSYNYRVTVVEDATFDRGEASHWISLYDMDQKYADVAPLSDVLERLRATDAGVFDDVLPATAGSVPRI